MSGAPPHLQGCNRLQLNIDNRNALDNPVLRIIFPHSLESCRFMDLYLWLWRNLAHGEQSKLPGRFAELTSGTKIVRTACRYPVSHRVPFGKALATTAAPMCYEAGSVTTPEDDLTEDDDDLQRPIHGPKFSTTTAPRHFLFGRQPVSHVLLTVFALPSFPCARFGSSYSRIGIRLWGG
jgi:hypothetical protein